MKGRWDRLRIKYIGPDIFAVGNKNRPVFWSYTIAGRAVEANLLCLATSVAAPLLFIPFETSKTKVL